VQHARRRVRSYESLAPHYLAPATRQAFLQTLDEIGWKQLPGPRWWAFLVDAVTRGMGPAFAYEHVQLRARLAGVQARHPLVDVDVIEEVLAFPPEAAFDPHRSRPLLRETTRGVLPDEVRLRPAKSTFDEVFHAGLAGPDLPLVRRLLVDRHARVGEYVDLGSLREDLEGQPPTERGARQAWAIRVWRLATAELWLRLQEDENAPRELVSRGGFDSPGVLIESDA
jgi:hypothetical protein